MKLLSDDEGRVWLSIPLSRETVERLTSLADVCRAEPETVAASMLHDILKDDEEAHFLLGAPPVGNA